MIFRLLKCFTLLIFLIGCSTPYGIPQIEDSSGSESVRGFPGIADIARTGDTRVIWIHGMCDHGLDWAEDRREIIATALKARRVADLRASKTAVPTEPAIVSFPFQAGHNRLDVDFLIWSPLTTPYKDRLLFDNSLDQKGEFKYRRASLNKNLKQNLINRCFSDAVVYSGKNGDPIRAWVKEQVCAGLAGNARNGRCDFQGGAPAVRTVLVAESLGSKILLDALREIWRENGGAKSRATAERFANIQSVFLLANQIPLLDAADVSLATARSDTGSDLASLLAEARMDAASLKAAALPTLHVVAFSDPNDLLSYRLPTGTYFDGDIQLVNVIVSNAPTVAGLFEMPDAAHCGYKWNQYVSGTLIHGYEGGKVIGVNAKLPKDCGF